MNTEPTIFIKQHREYHPRDYPFLDAPDLVICCGREMTYPEYVVARRLHPSKMCVTLPQEKNRELNQDSSFACPGVDSWPQGFPGPRKGDETQPTENAVHLVGRDLHGRS